MPDGLIPAIGVALSPLPILAMLLVLGGRRPHAAGSAFWLAWTLGVAAPTIAFVVAAERAGATDDDSGAIAAGEIVVGIVFLAVGARLALGPRRARSDQVPGWLEALDRSGPRRAAVLGLILSAGNPKNLALMLTAAVGIAQAGDESGEIALATAGFVALAVSTVTLLLAGYASRSGRSHGTLTTLRGTVARHDRTIAMVLAFVIGGFFVLDGVRGL
jgi:threonine/homoserine/homoserine lactone efflux protein